MLSFFCIKYYTTRSLKYFGTNLKKVVYTKHLINRLKVREIDEEVPKKIYIEASDRFIDTITGLFVACGSAFYAGKQREMVIIYKESEEMVEIVTVHPLKESQKKNRITMGRWVRDER